MAAVPACDQFAGSATSVGEVVVTAGGGVRVGEPGQDGRPDSQRSGVTRTAGGLSEGDGVRGVSSTRRLEGQVAQDVGTQGKIIDLMRGPKRRDEVALRQSVVGRVEGHPAGQLTDLRERADQTAPDSRRVAAFANQQPDSPELGSDIGQMTCPSVLVIEQLEHGEMLLDLVHERIGAE
ncbi:hypothetical protein Srubr_61400 [Streptomyces rubradiris]|uniref:Uncharacterized protein n=1 Tax=Streptomyces rubradiris TaxID=285531 RepID=A0ABQ3RK92_STRRR|nr:hypothetical protein GCM10018792_62010 [Streptomyces rubradiris]GHI56294.1 hypothetical protein Srubr_61400 [Streptomyces rubradiris]